MKIPLTSHELKDLCASCLREECEGRDHYHMNASICSRHEPVTLEHVKALMVAMDRLRSSPDPVVGGVPELLDTDDVWQDAAFLGKKYSAGLRDGYEIARKRASRLPALNPGEVEAIEKIIAVSRICANEGGTDRRCCVQTDDHHIALLELDKIRAQATPTEKETDHG